MPKYMLILTGDPNSRPGLSPDEIQGTITRFQAWIDQVKSEGRYVVSDKLMDEGGKFVTKQNGSVTVVDGPYSEAKEVVGGYFTLKAANYEEAVAIVRECPYLEWGNISIRQTDPMGCGPE